MCENTDGTLCMCPQKMSQSPAAPELLNDLACKCSLCDDNCTSFHNENPCVLDCECTAAVPWDFRDENQIWTNIYTVPVQNTGGFESELILCIPKLC